MQSGHEPSERAPRAPADETWETGEGGWEDKVAVPMHGVLGEIAMSKRHVRVMSDHLSARAECCAQAS